MRRLRRLAVGARRARLKINQVMTTGLDRTTEHRDVSRDETENGKKAETGGRRPQLSNNRRLLDLSAHNDDDLRGQIAENVSGR